MTKTLDPMKVARRMAREYRYHGLTAQDLLRHLGWWLEENCGMDEVDARTEAWELLQIIKAEE